MINDSLILLAGGTASRLGDFAKSTPKCMIPINNKPFLFILLDYYSSQGFHHIHLCLGHLEAIILKGLNDNYQSKAKLTYSNDGNTPLGTGGCIKKCLPYVSKKFFLAYADSYCPVNYKTLIAKTDSSPDNNIMCVIKNDGKYGESNLKIKNNKILSYDKDSPTEDYRYIDYGVSHLHADCFLAQNGTVFDLHLVWNHLIKNKMLKPFSVNGRFYELNTIESVKVATKALTKIL